MKTINWKQASELGLVERINTEILHPLGLAMCYDPSTGHSDALLLAKDGVWEYPEGETSLVLSVEDTKEKLSNMKTRDEDYLALTIEQYQDLINEHS